MLQKSSISKTMEIFFKNPNKEHYLIDISRNIKIAHTSVKNNLNKLKKQNLITETIKKQGKRNFPIYKANINKNFKKLKVIYNLNLILESNLIEFIEETLSPKSIVLFGSYSRAEDNEESDIDLFIECKEEQLNLENFKKKLGKNIELHFKSNFAEYPKELKNNIINGIVLSGFLEGYK